MRLIDVKTLQLAEFFSDAIPPYTILSHTWGDEEVTFKDLCEAGGAQARRMKGFAKIENCCALAAAEGFDFAWIDTCCIDKSSSAELSEAINSMFKWYRRSAICVAYLGDVDSTQDPTPDASDFARSRWFTRGWTLQELLAPTEIVFVGRDWGEIGTKRTLAAPISRITSISREALASRKWDSYSIAQKMSWAAGRQTTREEDEAYCLMGIFNVNMGLLYGEGRRAFFRLQEEIMRRYDDQSIFAWSHPAEQQSHVRLSGLLAPSPLFFKHCTNILTQGVSSSQLLSKVHGESEEYVHTFESIRQLIRVRSRVLGPLKAIQSEAIQDVPPEVGRITAVVKEEEGEVLYEVGDHRPGVVGSQLQSGDIVVSASDEDNPDRSPKRVMSDPDEPATLWKAGLLPHSRPNAGIRLVLETETLAESSYLEEVENTESRAPSAQDPGSRVDDLRPLLGSGKWKWYIYEPVIIAPLMCTLRGKHLGILLSLSGSKSEGVLSRLHHPSLICLDWTMFDFFSPLRTCYVYAESSSYYADEGEAAEDNGQTAPVEVRVHQLLERGYDVLEEGDSDWRFEAEKSRLVRIRERANSREPLVFFAHRSNEEENPSFFITIDFEWPVLGFSDFGLRSFNGGLYLKEIDMRDESHVRVPAPQDTSIVIKSRRLATVKYLSLAVTNTDFDLQLADKKLIKNKPQTPQERSILRTRLLGILSAAKNIGVELFPGSALQ